jgi:biotin carboxylase
VTTARPTILIIGSGFARVYREYALSSIAERYDVVLLDDVAPTWQAEYLADHLVVALDSWSAASEAVQLLAGKHRLAGVLTWDERWLELAARIAEEGRFGVHNSLAAVSACRDKLLTRRRLADMEVPSARSIEASLLEEATRAASEIGYPVVVKPRALAGSVGVVKVSSAADLADAFHIAAGARMSGISLVGGVLIEEFLDGPDISVECVTHEGVTAVVAVTRRRVGMEPYFEQLGHTVEAGDPLADSGSAVADVVRRALHALGVTSGVSHVELRLTPSGPRIIEVNARLAGDLIPYLVKLSTGVDLARAAADMAVGVSPDLRPTHFSASGVRFVYPTANGRLDSLEIDPHVADEAWLDRIAWVRTVGSQVSLPPHGFTCRLGLAVVTGHQAAVCDQRLSSVVSRVKMVIC